MKLQNELDIYLTPSIKEILDVFIGQNFKPLSVPFIADRLKLKPNTLIQRLHRNTDELFKTNDSKPQVVSIKPGIRAVVLFANRNSCRYCQQEKENNELTVQKSYSSSNPNDYNFLFLVCKSCLEKKRKTPGLIPKNKSDFISNIKEKTPSIQSWEYKTIQIRQIGYTPPRDLHPSFIYYVFRDLDESIESTSELSFDESESRWCYIAKEGNYPDNIKSHFIGAILNAFGQTGWEIINYRETSPEESRSDFFKGNIVEVLFKRSQTE